MTARNNKTPQVTVSFNGEKHALEEWTRKETAADQDKSLDWIGAFSDENDELQQQPKKISTDSNAFTEKKQPPAKNKWQSAHKKPMTKLRMIRFIGLPAAAALVVGLVIGMSLLMVLNEQAPKEKNTWASGAQSNQQTGTSTIASSDLNLSLYLIQAGLFGSPAKAKQIASQLNAPAVVMPVTGGNAIFVGAAQNEKEADQMIKAFEGNGMDVFKKKMTLQAAAAAAKDQNKAKTARAAKKMIQQYLALSAQPNRIAASGQNVLQTVDKLYKSVSGLKSDRATKQVMDDLKQMRAAAAQLATDSSTQQAAAFHKCLLESIAHYNALIHS
ncbi:SPOR domain-containing protein [Sporolactobacillus terrae]|uniref:SPOR domain-containing protein n=1 Tax=Sporolactobacillus terrae TaxID=269673 RepID=UPI00048B0F36|nr:SPOR domain-containing protein [Sporolactobacillus terrae]